MEEPDTEPNPGAGGAHLAQLIEGPGTKVDPYKLLQEIGEGGMGVVYMAEQQEPVRRRVALKVIKLGMDTRDVIARFEAERQALAMMDHPNIAKALDAGATGSGRPYFVMELVQGIPITEYCDQNQLAPEERIRLFVRVCRAVQHAHQKGIIHRDLKPSNVMVSLHDGEPVPKVIDFGIAKATRGQLTEKTLFTRYGAMVGTPTYVSPEQAEMSGLDVDTRSDIYSLGVLLHELLTGTTPLSQDEVRTAGAAGLSKLIREKRVHRPSTRLSTMGAALSAVARSRGTEPSKLGKLLRGDLDWIVLKCLEQDRTRRYETANALAADLERSMASEPIAARPRSSMYALGRFVRRNRGLAASAAALVSALVVMAVGGTWLALRARQAEAEAEMRAGEAQEARAAAAARAEALAEQVELNYFATVAHAAGELARGDVARFRRMMQVSGYASAQDDPRGWEWFYLLREARQAEVVLREHAGPVFACSWSPDGRWIASGGADGRVLLWDARARTLARGLAAGGGAVRALAWSREGRLAAAGESGAIRVWNPADPSAGETVLRGHSAAVTALAWGRDGGLASAASDRQIVVWDVARGRVDDSLATPLEPSALAWQPAGEALAYALGDEQGTTRVWGRTGGGGGRDLLVDTYRDGVRHLAWGGAGDLAAATGSEHVRVWDPWSGALHFEKQVHDGAVLAAAWNPNADRELATAGVDGLLRVWSLADLDSRPDEVAAAAAAATFVGHGGAVRAVAWSPDGSQLASGGDDGEVAIWDRGHRGTGRRRVEQFPQWIDVVAWSPDGTTVAACGPQNDGVFFVEADGPTIHREELPKLRLLEVPSPATILWGPSGSGLLAVGGGRGLGVWTWPELAPAGIAIPAAGDHLEAWCGDRIVTREGIWDLASGEAVSPGLRLPGGDRPLVAAAHWSADGRLLATGSYDGSIHLWDGDSLAHLRGWHAFSGALEEVRFSPDGGKLAAGDERGDLAVFAVPDGSGLFSLRRAHAGKVKAIRWRPPHGDRLASAGQFGDIRLFDGARFRDALNLRGDAEQMYSIDWSPDGSTLAGSGYENSLRLWSALDAAAAARVTNAEFADGPAVRGGEPPPWREGLRRLWEGAPPKPDASLARQMRGMVAAELREAPGDPFLLATRALLDLEEGGAGAIGAVSRLLDGGEVLPARNRARLLRARVEALRTAGEFEGAAEANRELLGFPPRPAGTPSGAIDLSAFYTAPLDADLHRSTGNHLLDLAGDPGRLRPSAGPGFDLRGVVHLSCVAATEREGPGTGLDAFPVGVYGIPVERKCARLHFLHASGWHKADEDGSVLGHIEIRYTERPPERIELRYAEPGGELAGAPHRSSVAKVWDWWYPDPVALPAEAVWSGSNEPSRRSGRRLALFQHVWENPHPEESVRSIDYVSAMQRKAAPFLISVSAD